MTDYVNPTGFTAGTAGDDSFTFTRLVGSSTSVNGTGGRDRLEYDVASAGGRMFTVSFWDIGTQHGLQGQVWGRNYSGPRLTFYEFEDVTFVGTDSDDSFEFAFSRFMTIETVAFDAGAGRDLLTFDFSNSLTGFSFVLANGAISSTYGQFAGFEEFYITGSSGNDTITTGDGDDHLRSGAGVDTVATGDGDDTIYTEASGTFDAGAGSDVWQGNYSAATTALTVDIGASVAISNGTTVSNAEIVSVGTGAGDDTFNVTHLVSGLSGGAGYDKLNLALAEAQSFLVNTTDTRQLLGGIGSMAFSEFEEVSFTGGAQDDSFRILGLFNRLQITFDGGAGSDFLQGEFGSLSGASRLVVHADGSIVSNRGQFTSFERFFLVGGSDADTFVTGDGDDWLNGVGGDDYLSGKGGNDSLYGDQGDDRLDGGSGDDQLYGVTGDDTLDGGTGDDWLSGEAGADHIVGGSGTDELRGDDGNDFLAGDAGNDVLIGGAGRDQLDGGIGIDTADYSAAASAVAIRLDRVSAQNTGAAGGVDTLLNVENLVGGDFADRLTGNALANDLDGGNGDDTLNGLAGNDVLHGGYGDDVYYVDAAGDVVIETALAGSDKVIAAVDHVLADEVESLALVGTARIGTGNGLANTIVGSNGADTLSGLAGDDVLRGAMSRDSLARRRRRGPARRRRGQGHPDRRRRSRRVPVPRRGFRRHPRAGRRDHRLQPGGSREDPAQPGRRERGG